MARISRVLLILGLVLLILGIALVVLSPSLVKVSWEPKSISTEQTLGALARFKETKKEEKIDEVISVNPYYLTFLNKWDNTYNSYFSFPPSISIDGESKARTLPVKIRVGSTAEFKIAVKIEELPFK